MRDARYRSSFRKSVPWGSHELANCSSRRSVSPARRRPSARYPRVGFHITRFDGVDAPLRLVLCGASPLPASSEKTQRHRLNRGGNRQANSALHMIVVCRMRTDQRTRDYVARRTEEGLSKREVMRCLKRYVAREIYRVLTAPSPT